MDLVLSMFDDGYVAAVPTDANVDIRKGAYDPMELRTGKILQWYPKHVKVRVYNENTGHREDLTLPKRSVAIIQNPLYAVMNQPNSTLQRLIRKLTLLDAIDEQTSVGKLDLIIQLPATCVSKVNSVTIDGDDFTEYSLSTNGTLHLFDVPRLSRKSSIVVAYVAGLGDA